MKLIRVELDNGEYVRLSNYNALIKAIEDSGHEYIISEVDDNIKEFYLYKPSLLHGSKFIMSFLYDYNAATVMMEGTCVKSYNDLIDFVNKYFAPIPITVRVKANFCR